MYVLFLFIILAPNQILMKLSSLIAIILTSIGIIIAYKQYELQLQQHSTDPPPQGSQVNSQYDNRSEDDNATDSEDEGEDDEQQNTTDNTADGEVNININSDQDNISVQNQNGIVIKHQRHFVISPANPRPRQVPNYRFGNPSQLRQFRPRSFQNARHRR